MALLDFIELSDDEEIVVPKKNDEEIVDLSSDDEDETAEESHNDFTCGNPGQHDGQAMFVAEGGGEAKESGNAEDTESGNADEATPCSSVTEKESLGTAASQNCSHTPTAISFPGPTSFCAKALTFKACDANLPRAKAKRRRKLSHTDTPWRSPRLELKNKDRSKSMEELAVDLKRSRMPGEENTPGRSKKKKRLFLCAKCRMCKDHLY